MSESELQDQIDDLEIANDRLERKIERLENALIELILITQDPALKQDLTRALKQNGVLGK